MTAVMSIDDALVELSVNKKKTFAEKILMVARLTGDQSLLDPKSFRNPPPLSEWPVLSERKSRRGLNGHVYFIQAGEFIKIGYAADPNKRLLSIKTGSPLPVKIIHFFPGTMKDERSLHSRFSHLRAEGEWFRVEPDLVSFIDGLRK